MVRPLTGVRVLTVDNYEAGNYGPMLLALHGADVVKVEMPGRGDVLRSAGPFTGAEASRRSHGEIRLMRGKRSIELDLREPAGREVLRRLLRKADVFWTNLQPSSLERLGFDWESARSVNPRLVYASITGFGLPSKGDVRADYPAFDIIIQSLAGLLMRNAGPDGAPEYNGIPVVDQVTSLLGVLGVLLALRVRDQTGSGCCVDASMFDAGVALNEKALTVFGLTGEIARPRSSATSAPFGVYRTSDGFVTIGVGGNPVWERMCKVLERTDLLERLELRDGSGRVRVAETVIRPAVEEWTMTRSTKRAVAELLEGGVPSAPVLDVDTVLRSTVARARIFEQISDPDGSPIDVVMSPVRLLGVESATNEYPHRLGEDTDEVLAEWLGAKENDND
jgi:formyl-CoA transferase